MYLKKIAFKNFRKFRTQNNEICFAAARDYIEDEKVNIAPKTTLIIGKNNSGKTTVIEGLKRLVFSSGFCATDFNFDYLKELLKTYTLEYLNKTEEKAVPTLEFVVTVVIDNNQKDLLTNLIPFMSVGDVKDTEVQIIIQWVPKNEEFFFKSVRQFVMNGNVYKSQKFDRFLNLLDENEFCFYYFNSSKEKRDNFSLKKLIDIEPISANNITSEECLSKAFSKIVDYRYKQIKNKQSLPVLGDLDNEIISINEKLTGHIQKEHTENINNVLGRMIMSEKCQVLLKADLNFQSLLRSILKYEYLEGERQIPENQFGLGYTNLMMIIADIITYMEKYPEDSFNSQINLISIEEPETFMHPQMQELFIKNVNEMISSLLESKNKHINSQIIITTHSPHILNSKIHEGNTFDNINYITIQNNESKAIFLSDEKLIKEDNISSKKTQKKRWKREQNLKFIKKHIKFKVSEIFFSEVVIFVEGITEYTLLQHYLSEDVNINQYYISIILIDGAHAKVYEKITKILSIPTLIITDIDYKREKYEKNEVNVNYPKKKSCYLQMDKESLKNRMITNSTIAHFYRTSIAEEIVQGDYFIDDNLMVICQKQDINKYYPTSFEEAFILTNEKNRILHEVLKKVKPEIYKEIIQNGGLAKNSYKLQNKLSDSKSDFANELLFEILMNDKKTTNPELPQYIQDGLKFITKRLKGDVNGI